MIQPFTNAWMEKLAESINQDARFRELAADLTGEIVLGIPKENKYLRLKFQDGGVNQRSMHSSVPRTEGDSWLRVEGNMRDWDKLFTYRTDILRLIFSGELRILGSRESLRDLWKENLRALNELGRKLANVDRSTDSPHSGMAQPTLL